MKFITRELYDAMQVEPDTPEKAVADARWESQCDAYRKHLQAIVAHFPERMREFYHTTLHDGIIKTAARPNDDLVILEIDGTNCCYGPIGQFELRFEGVREVDGLEEIANGWWLYEEVHLHPDAGFEYRVLLVESQFRIVADDVWLTNTSGNNGLPL